MKLLKPILLLFICLSIFTSFSQKNIIAGEGYGQVKIGMSIDELKELIGVETAIISYEDEKASYIDSEYDPLTNLGFLIGFDNVYLFQNDNAFAVWKVYVKKNKVVYMNISSYTATLPIISELTIQDSLKFFQGTKEMEASFGTDYVKCVDPNGYITFTYVQQGIRFLYEGTKLRNVFIFKALKGKKARKLIDVLPNTVAS